MSPTPFIERSMTQNTSSAVMAQRNPSTAKTERIALRISPELRLKLEDAAAKGARTLSAEIERRLWGSF